MIRHIIMFKFSEVKNDEEKSEMTERMIKSFSPLKDKIGVVKSYEIGVNSKKTDFSYDIVITSEYESWEDLDTYIKHPYHQNAIKLNQDIKKEKAVVDYEF